MATPPESLQAFIWELRRAFRELSAAADAGFAPLGIGAGDRALLDFLSRESGPVSLSALARKHAVSRQHIHQALQRLPEPRWVETRPDPADSRALNVQLTAEGRRFWKLVQARERALLADLGQGLEPEALARALDFLRQLRASIPTMKEN